MRSDQSRDVRPPLERRRSTRVALEIPLQLLVNGVGHVVQTVLASHDGVLIYSPVLCDRGAEVEVRNPVTGQAGQASVVWAWAERANDGRVVRLALEKIGDEPAVWVTEYERHLRFARLQSEDRRRGPRLAIRMPLEVFYDEKAYRAETLDVSDRGARILSEGSHEQGAVLRLTRSSGARSADFRVVWVEAVEPEETPVRGCEAGLAMVEGSPGFWGR